eukprot:116162_1
MSVYNVQSIIMYCDFSDLSHDFSATLRPLYFGETASMVTQRHLHYYHFAKLLRETVQYFGSNRHDATGPFYCGMNRVLAMPSFSLIMNCPLSTSGQKEIAIRFAGSNGIVLQLKNDADYESKNHIRCFDCRGLSNYSAEDEYLFFESGNALKLESVRVIEGKQGKCQNFERTISLFFILDSMLIGTNMEGSNMEKISQSA